MTLSLKNQLSTLGMRIKRAFPNFVTLPASDEESGMTIVFIGTISNCHADFTSATGGPAPVQAQFARLVPVASVGPGWVGEPGGVNGALAPPPPPPPSACTGTAGSSKSLACGTF
jgi:hypothetical protein